MEEERVRFRCGLAIFVAGEDACCENCPFKPKCLHDIFDDAFRGAVNEFWQEFNKAFEKYRDDDSGGAKS